MKRTLIISLLISLCASAACAVDETAPEKKVEDGGDKPVYHTVVPKDTLWDISKKYLTDPFKWPNLWKNNAYIKNPHLIYPGNVIKITPDGIEAVEAKEGGAEKGLPVVTLSGDDKGEKVVVLEPEAGAEGEAARAADGAAAAKQASDTEKSIKAPTAKIVRKGFITDTEPATIGAVVSSKEDKHNIFHGDYVYLSIKEKDKVKAGDRYLIYAIDGEVDHPVTGKRIGRIIDALGVIRITSTGGVPEGVVEVSYKEITPGALLTEYREPAKEIAVTRASKDVNGVVLASLEGTEQLSTGDILYIDKGAKDGLKAGNLLRVYREKEKEAADPVNKRKYIELPPTELGTIMVLEEGETASSCVVVKSLKQINVGDPVSTIGVK